VGTTKLAASSRACSTTLLLLLSGDVVWDEAITPTQEAADPAAELAAKAGATMAQASRAENRVIRIMVVLAGCGPDYRTWRGNRIGRYLRDT
jgi:hypothetical protein